MSKSKKMYDKPPVAERDAKDGKIKVKKPSKADAVQAGVDGMPIEVEHAHARRAMHHRHETEHMAMNHTHEMEHGAHDAAKGGDKAKLHDKHETDHKEMSDRHHKERKMLHAKHGKGHAKGEAKEGGAAIPHKKEPEMPKETKKAKTGRAGEKE